MSEVTEVDTESRTVKLGSSVWTYPEHVPLPEVGDDAIWHTVQGSLVRGVDHNGVRVMWKTDDELAADRQRRHDEYQAEKDAKFEQEKSKLDADYDALPEPLQARIASLRAAGGDRWRADNESYEMFTCTEAVKIYEHFNQSDTGLQEMQDWYELPYDEQKAVVPIDDGHSGNTFGMAAKLAAELLRGNAGTVAVLPAALSPLSGDPRYPRDA